MRLSANEILLCKVLLLLVLEVFVSESSFLLVKHHSALLFTGHVLLNDVANGHCLLWDVRMLKILKRLIQAFYLFCLWQSILCLRNGIHRVRRSMITAFQDRHHPIAILHGQQGFSVFQLCQVLAHISPMMRLRCRILIIYNVRLGRAILVRLLIVNLLDAIGKVGRLSKLKTSIANRVVADLQVCARIALWVQGSAGYTARRW